MQKNPPAYSKFFWLAVASLIALLTFWAISSHKAPTTPSQKIQGIKVLARTFSAGDHHHGLALHGATAAMARVDLTAETQGKIAHIKVKDGASVTKGETIFLITQENRPHNLQKAQARVRQHHLDFNAAKALELKSFQARSQVAKAEADLRESEAEANELQLDLQRTVVKAPFSGHLVKAKLDEGAFVQAGTPLGEIVNLTPLRVVVYVSEHDYMRIKLDQPCTVRLAGEKELDGKITYKSPSSSNKTRTFEVWAQIPNPKGDIPDGVSATVCLPTVASSVFALPASLLTLDAEGVMGVKTIDEQQKVRFVPVQVLSSDQSKVLVESPLLTHSARIITRGQEFVTEGQTVEATEEEQASPPERSPSTSSPHAPALAPLPPLSSSPSDAPESPPHTRPMDAPSQ